MAVTAPQVLEKQPSEKRQFTVNLANLMVTGETIASITSVTSELIGGGTTDLVITGSAISGQTVIMWIASGTHNNRYRIEVIVVTSTGAIIEGDGILKVSDRS